MILILPKNLISMAKVLELWKSTLIRCLHYNLRDMSSILDLKAPLIIIQSGNRKRLFINIYHKKPSTAL